MSRGPPQRLAKWPSFAGLWGLCPARFLGIIGPDSSVSKTNYCSYMLTFLEFLVGWFEMTLNCRMIVEGYPTLAEWSTV